MNVTFEPRWQPIAIHYWKLQNVWGTQTRGLHSASIAGNPWLSNPLKNDVKRDSIGK